MQEFYAVFEATLRECGEAQALEALRQHVDHRTTVDRIAALFERAGFRVSRVYEEPATMRFLDGSSLLRHYFIKLAFLDDWRKVVDAEAQAEVFSQLETSLNRLAEERGELALTIPMAYIEGEPVPR
jgi:hypothetical protein